MLGDTLEELCSSSMFKWYSHDWVIPGSMILVFLFAASQLQSMGVRCTTLVVSQYDAFSYVSHPSKIIYP